VVWGGEPLLRQDLPELLLAARSAGLTTTLISNGWLLEHRWPELRGLVDVLVLSLDDHGEAHDRLRGLPGLSARLEAAVAKLARDPQFPLLLVNTVLSRFNQGALDRVAPVARRWGAGLYFCPMETGEMQSAGYVDRHGDLALAATGLRAAALQAAALQRAGYPILNTRAYLRLLARDPALRGYTCRMPRSLLTVEADGAVRDCLRTDRPLTSVAELRAGDRPLASVYTLPRYRELRRDATACTKCNNPDVIELSWLWDLHPAMLEKLAELAWSRGRRPLPAGAMPPGWSPPGAPLMT
jgi:MoaA/NifB/PqqE/SkfB family radical SAM enzyme